MVTDHTPFMHIIVMGNTMLEAREEKEENKQK